jgi:ubiquinone/menaquinone biosynthesis C-methylase UbiE
MRNLWLDIPLDDYEAHMALPQVGQARLLSDALAEAMRVHRPRSLAVLGCAGGNGLERIREGEVDRVVGIDINPHYIDAARTRFSGRISGLELLVGDIQNDRFAFDPVEMAFAGLLFEYLDARAALPAVRSMLTPRGVLVVVLQLPSSSGEVTPSPYRSLGALSGVLHLLPPEEFERRALESGFTALDSSLLTASGGKRFHAQGFRKNP